LTEIAIKAMKMKLLSFENSCSIHHCRQCRQHNQR
jgi:hypothetical protein